MRTSSHCQRRQSTRLPRRYPPSATNPPPTAPSHPDEPNQARSSQQTCPSTLRDAYRAPGRGRRTRASRRGWSSSIGLGRYRGVRRKRAREGRRASCLVLDRRSKALEGRKGKAQGGRNRSRRAGSGEGRGGRGPGVGSLGATRTTARPCWRRRWRRRASGRAQRAEGGTTIGVLGRAKGDETSASSQTPCAGCSVGVDSLSVQLRIRLSLKLNPSPFPSLSPRATTRTCPGSDRGRPACLASPGSRSSNA